MDFWLNGIYPTCAILPWNSWYAHCAKALPWAPSSSFLLGSIFDLGRFFGIRKERFIVYFQVHNSCHTDTQCMKYQIRFVNTKKHMIFIHFFFRWQMLYLCNDDTIMWGFWPPVNSATFLDTFFAILLQMENIIGILKWRYPQPCVLIGAQWNLTDFVIRVHLLVDLKKLKCMLSIYSYLRIFSAREMA